MVWLNGEWKEEGEATVAVSDEAFLRGEGVFETMLALNGEVFELARHWSRFELGCERFAFELLDLSQAMPLLAELLERNCFEAGARVRVRATRSRENLLFSAKVSDPTPEDLILLKTPYRRNEQGALAGLKAISYGENSVALAEGRLKGAHEVLFANTRGHWCEGAWSNVFAVEEGRLLTPPLRSGCLPGVTREVVLELGGDLGLEVGEEERPMEGLTEVDELFLTSSVMGIGAVTRFEERVLERGRVTEELSRRLRAREEGGAL